MPEPNKTLHEIKLRDLNSLLRSKNKDLVVVDYKTAPLLPPGENYGSTILKVDAVVKKDKYSKEEQKLHLVAKMLPATDFLRMLFDSPYTVKKEIFLYEELLPTYRNLEREFGFGEHELFDVTPRLFGARCSLEPGKTEVDEDAVILMQNLRVLGYYCVDRRKGFDLVHAKVAISALARFHGLGMALKQHKPEVFEKVKHRAKNYPFDYDLSLPFKFFLRIFSEDSTLSRHYDFLKKALVQNMSVLLSTPPTEPWSTIIHADFWVNNIMFRNKEEVKFVDFQNYLFFSPTRELILCLMVNLNEEVIENNFDYLLDYYYEKLIAVLERMRCDTSQLSKDDFNERLQIDSFLEFQHILFSLQVMTADVKNGDNDNAENMYKKEKANPLLVDKLRKVVLKYVEKGWILEQDTKKELNFS